MKTKVIAEKFKLTYMEELKRDAWVREETYEVFTFKTKKAAIEYLKDMKKFVKKISQLTQILQMQIITMNI